MRSVPSRILKQVCLPFFVVVPIGNNGRFRALILVRHRERGLCPRLLWKPQRLIEIQPAQMGLARMRLPPETHPEFITEGHSEYDEPAIVCDRCASPKSARVLVISYGQIAPHPRLTFCWRSRRKVWESTNLYAEHPMRCIE
jgi:hypothetical protein